MTNLFGYILIALACPLVLPICGMNDYESSDFTDTIDQADKKYKVEIISRG